MHLFHHLFCDTDTLKSLKKWEGDIAVMNSDCEAEAILAQLRAGNVPEGVAAEGNRYLYEQKKITKDTLLNYCDNPEAVQKRI